MRKVLIITTHFAPDIHVGAKRAVKFAKYLPKFGWNPVVLTVDEKYYHGVDDSLNEDLPDSSIVFRARRWCLPKKAAFVSTGQLDKTVINDNGHNRNSFVRKCVRRLMLYDFAWLLPAIYEGLRIVRREKIDVLFSTSPNSEAHLVGLCLRVITRQPWVADFRDPWSALHEFYKTGCFKRVFDKFFEKTVLKKANHFTAISRTLTRDLNELRGQQKRNNNSIIYNGYDQDDFDEIGNRSTLNTQPFTMSYLGTWGGGRSPEVFLRALGKLFMLHPSFKNQIRVNFIGEVKIDSQMQTTIRRVMSEEDLFGVVKMVPFLPHRKAYSLLKKSHMSVLVVSSFHSRVGCLSSKLFQYLYVGNPILALVPLDSEEAQIIRKYGVGQIVVPDDVSAISRKIEEMYTAFRIGNWTSDVNPCRIEKFDREKQAGKLGSIFNSLSGDA